jgi:hypothetical protein
LLTPVSRGRAQTTITIVEAPPPTFTFGSELVFELSARSSADIAEVRVFYRSGGAGRTIAGSARFDAGREVTASYAVDLATRPLPPFSQVEYWWEVLDSAGARLRTEPRTFTYEDNRFVWQSLSDGAVTVRWHAGDSAFGQAALDAAVAALAQANRDLRAPLPDEVSIYIYADEQQLRESLGRVGLAWVGGHADPALGVVIVPVAPGLDAGLRLARLIPHELTHVLIYAAVGDSAAYARVPTWLNEGLAVMNQLQPDPEYPVALAEARDAGNLLSLDSLCGAFPADPALARLAYAQSESVVRYVRGRFGAQRLNTLLAAYADGAACQAGVQNVLGLSLAELEADWLRDVIRADPATFRLRALAPWLLLAALVGLGPGLFLLLTFSARRTPARTAGPG